VELPRVFSVGVLERETTTAVTRCDWVLYQQKLTVGSRRWRGKGAINMSTAMNTAASQGFTCALTDRREVAEGTMAFRFEKPRGWTFKAGQYLDMTLLNPSEMDSEGNVRSFSIASAPQEATLMIATRMRDSAFKRELRKMAVGSAVKIEGPSGDFVLHTDPTRAAVFIAGGIGITPFRSIAHWAAKEKLPQRILLFYSNRRPEDAAFLTELEGLEKENANYKLVATMTEPEKSSQAWSGETGLIDQKMLSKYTKDLASPIYYIAGPPGMVAGMNKTLEGANVSKDDIRSEDFSGY
jgi:ferredoxin-NADP reductase